MKKKYLLFLLLAALVLVVSLLYFFGHTIGRTPVRYGEALQTEVEEGQITRFFGRHGWSVVSWMPVSSNETIVACDQVELFTGYRLRFFLYQITDNNEKATELNTVNSETVTIFYDSDWYLWQKIYGSKIEYTDLFEGACAVIYIQPNYDVTEKDYRESEFYGAEPWSNANLSPMLVQTSRWEGGFPTWVYFVPLNQIDADLQVHFGDWVLTGEDILTRSWHNGSAPALR